MPSPSLPHLHPQYITDQAGKRQSVILPVNEFQQLLEDLEDLIALAERKEEDTTSHAELLKELKQDGLI